MCKRCAKLIPQELRIITIFTTGFISEILPTNAKIISQARWKGWGWSNDTITLSLDDVVVTGTRYLYGHPIADAYQTMLAEKVEFLLLHKFFGSSELMTHIAEELLTPTKSPNTAKQSRKTTINRYIVSICYILNSMQRY